MSVDEPFSTELQSAIVEMSDLLDGLADLGVVMMNISNKSAAGRDQWIDNQLRGIAIAAHNLSLLCEQLENSNVFKAADTLEELALDLVNSAKDLASWSNFLESPERTCKQMFENWNKTCAAVGRLVSALGSETALWWREIEERRPAYRATIWQLNIHCKPS